jgi:hypothetical protein
MQWNRSNTLGIAKNSCTYCSGNGTRLVRNDKEVPCNCVFRAIFRACYHRFRECAAKSTHTSSVTLELCRGREGRRTYSRKREEYIADFCLVSQRTLDEYEHKVFRIHFLLGADWRLCCRQLKIDRGEFFHTVYRIEQRLGRTFAELRPFPLYPLDEYFGSLLPKADSEADLDWRNPRYRKNTTLRLPLTA